ncbi:sensor histidine kinase [Nocardioides jiangxiensis]|uniref:histidine kinase n=1 Tax=Nocardioides jiangxiensis TaxID=3064524 RepID=A0ABT9AYQ9_9ACTN|nr:HAMP domain-containing sensor histidine kinase [Nocardioides sp. WY-20]MDO7867225.1 HAMP domain-containing sensor histidine kinase [Nocardioides sp. WY-20]
MRRLPIHVRLIAGFAAAMFVLLTAAGVFVYERVEYALDRGLDTELKQATDAIRPLVDDNGHVLDHARAAATGADWQVLRPGLTRDAVPIVEDAGGSAPVLSLVGGSRLPAAGTRTFDVGSIFPGGDTPARRVRVYRLTQDGPLLLVAVRRNHRDEALRELFVQLVLAGLASLAVTTLIGGLLARSALRPVERYRARAAEIAAGQQGLRLDVPAGRDDEVTRLGHTLNAMLTAQEQALERERRFVQDASHELRTPLTLLKARIQMTRSRPRDREAYERALDELGADVERLAQLSEDLLEQATPTSSLDTVDVGVVAREVARERGGVQVSAAARSTATGLDEPGLRRVLTNLLDNAALHGAPPVTVTVDRVGDRVRLVVEDAGTGLSPDLLDTVTGRFTRAPEARGRRGSGLGLSLVEQLVTSAGGELRLCCGGGHASYGVAAAVPCAHGDRMRVTVLLPAA